MLTLDQYPTKILVEFEFLMIAPHYREINLQPKRDMIGAELVPMQGTVAIAHSPRNRVLDRSFGILLNGDIGWGS